MNNNKVHISEHFSTIHQIGGGGFVAPSVIIPGIFTCLGSLASTRLWFKAHQDCESPARGGESDERRCLTSTSSAMDAVWPGDQPDRRAGGYGAL